MSLDLTGGLLVAFILSEIQPVLARHPRYRANAGEAFQTNSNLIYFRDVSATMGNLRGESTRLSPDYYVGTALGRAMVAQINGKPGSFIEWFQEIDPSRATPVPGMYYLGVDTVNEQTREVRFIQQATRTVEGEVKNADGTVLGFDPSIPLHLVQATDSTAEFELAGTKMWLLNYKATLSFTRTDTGAPLVPGVDWWLERTVRIPLGVTSGGSQALQCPDSLVNMVILDGEGLPMSKGTDWRYVDGDRILLSAWTTAGQTLVAQGTARVDPNTAPLVHPENLLSIPLAVGETLLTDSVLYWTPSGDFTYDDTVLTPDGTLCITNLLTPGDDLRWEAQAGTSQVYVAANKMEMSTKLVPGLNIAIGDQVEVGDQCCLVVTPDVAEAYKVYGGKDNVSFDLTIKANDLTTAGELASMVKQYLLVEGRDRMESAGVTIFSAPSAYQGEQKDPSGTTVSHSVSLSVSCAADWEFYRPIVNRIVAIGIDLVVTEGYVKGKMGLADGRSQFVTSYF